VRARSHSCERSFGKECRHEWRHGTLKTVLKK
jgi:hypothetical protein